MKTYALYRGDELLSIGTVKEIAKEMSVKVCTIQYYATSTYRRRVANRKKGEFYKQRNLVCIDD